MWTNNDQMQYRNEKEMLEGNIVRLSISNDPEELDRMYQAAQQRLSKMRELAHRRVAP